MDDNNQQEASGRPIHDLLDVGSSLKMLMPMICVVQGKTILSNAMQTPALVDGILAGWDSFTGSDFKPV